MERTEADDEVEEVRRVRRAIWAQFDNDPEPVIAYCAVLDKRYAGRMISPAASKQRTAAT